MKKRKRSEMPNTKAWEINKHREIQLKAMEWYQQMLYIFLRCCDVVGRDGKTQQIINKK